MRIILSRLEAFRLLNNAKSNVSVVVRSSPQLAVTATTFTRPRYYTPGPEGHIRDATDSAFSKKEKAVEDQWVRLHDAEKIKKLREQLADHKKKLEELEDNLEELEKKKED